MTYSLDSPGNVDDEEIFRGICKGSLGQQRDGGREKVSGRNGKNQRPIGF